MRSVLAYEKLDFNELSNVWLTYTVFYGNYQLADDYSVAMLKELQRSLKEQNAHKRKQLRRYKKGGLLAFSKLPENDLMTLFEKQDYALSQQVYEMMMNCNYMEQNLTYLAKLAKSENRAKSTKAKNGRRWQRAAASVYF